MDSLINYWQEREWDACDEGQDCDGEENQQSEDGDGDVDDEQGDGQHRQGQPL